MDTEFINAFIAKQKAMIDDLMSKVLLAETKIAVMEKTISDLSNKLEKQENQKEKTSSKE